MPVAALQWMAGAFLFVLVADLALLAVWAWNRPLALAGRAKPVFSATWSLVHIWIALQVFLVAMVAVSLVLLAPWMVASGGLSDPAGWMRRNPALVLSSLLPQNALMVAIVIITVKKLYGEPLAAIGFRLLPEKRDLKLGVCYGLATLAALFVLQFFVTLGITMVAGEGAFRQIESASKQLGIEGLMEEWIRSKTGAALLLIGGGVLAPIGEEFFFRGFVFNAGRRRLGLWGGTLISSALFALVHLGPLNILLIFPVGIALALAYHASRSLWVPIVMHALFNSLQIIAAILVANVL